MGEADTLAEARRLGDVDAYLVAAAPPTRTTTVQSEPLTSRELEVLAALADGLSNKAIAARLGISDETVKFHLSAIFGKLGASNRTDAVRQALRRGIVELDAELKFRAANVGELEPKERAGRKTRPPDPRTASPRTTRTPTSCRSWSTCSRPRCAP